VDAILELLANPVAIGWVAVAVVVALIWLTNKKPELKKYEGLALYVFNMVEKMVPDNSKGKVNKWDLFLKKFIEEYAKRTGKQPSENLLGDVSSLIEGFVAVKNARREG